MKIFTSEVNIGVKAVVISHIFKDEANAEVTVTVSDFVELKHVQLREAPRADLLENPVR